MKIDPLSVEADTARVVECPKCAKRCFEDTVTVRGIRMKTVACPDCGWRRAQNILPDPRGETKER